MIYLKKFVLEIAEEKELKLLDRTKDQIRDVEREMENGIVKKTKEEISVEYVVKTLKGMDELKKGFGGSEWATIEKEVSRMLK